MKASETTGLLYLKSKYGDERIEIEPLGKSNFPDFSIGANAFEVTEIHCPDIQGAISHQAILGAAVQTSIDEINQKIKKQSQNFDGIAYLVDVNLGRNVLRPHALKKELKARLSQFYKGESISGDPSIFSVRHTRIRTGNKNDFFVCGSSSLSEVGSLVVQDYYDAISHAVNRKTNRLRLFNESQNCGRFESFSLILVDHLAPKPMPSEELILALAQIEKKSFNEIVVIRRDSGGYLTSK